MVLDNIDLMINTYIGGLFALLVVTVHALIVSKANKLYTFIIIPLALVMSLFTWQAITMLRGLPIYGLPYDEDITILYVYDHKPWIYTVLMDPEKGPMLYKIDWTKQNQKKMQGIKRNIGTDKAEGQFKKGLHNDVESFEPSNIKADSAPIEKRVIVPSKQTEITYQTYQDRMREELNTSLGAGPVGGI